MVEQRQRGAFGPYGLTVYAAFTRLDELHRHTARCRHREAIALKGDALGLETRSVTPLAEQARKAIIANGGADQAPIGACRGQTRRMAEKTQSLRFTAIRSRMRAPFARQASAEKRATSAAYRRGVPHDGQNRASAGRAAPHPAQKPPPTF